MISKLSIIDSAHTPIKWLPKVEALSKPRDFEFKPGVNIIWGKNGSGKSTLLRLIAKLFHAEQGQISTVTEQSLQELFGFGYSAGTSMLSGVGVDHDGQAAIYYEPSAKVGLIGGGAGFDDDFFLEGVMSMKRVGSSGQLTAMGLAQACDPLRKNKGKPIMPNYKISKSAVNEAYVKRIESTEQFFEKTIELGPTTVMLDEPDRSLDLPGQKESWKAIANISKVQLIIATHSVFALNIPGANYIEFTPGYLEECRAAVKNL